MRDAAEPLSDGELAALAAAAFRDFTGIVLGVSGGADSLCLLLLAEAAAKALSPPRQRFVAATVDHGWRTEAAAEALWVGERAQQYGVPHHVLTWDEPKPETGRQNAARRARYRLLGALAADLDLGGPVAIATAHHSDDQAETFLMRLARGSGVDGLSAMARRRVLAEIPGAPQDLCLVRPFLEIPKARLVATLRARGLSWIEDPGNTDSAFERVRVRQALATLADLGISHDAIGRSARRVAQARMALDAVTDSLIQKAVDLHDGAMASISPALFDAAPTEIRLRLLQRLWPAIAGPGHTPRRSQLDDLVERLETSDSVATTLAGAAITRESPAAAVTLFREPGRSGLPELQLKPGQNAIWDGRFEVSLAATAPTAVAIRALRADAPAPCTNNIRDLPRRATLTLPCAWTGSTLLGVLHPAFPGVGGLRVRHLQALDIPLPADRRTPPRC